MLLVALVPLAGFGWIALEMARENVRSQVEKQLGVDAALTMQKIQQGDFSHRAPETGRDELGDMARAFNSMSDRLISPKNLGHAIG